MSWLMLRNLSCCEGRYESSFGRNWKMAQHTMLAECLAWEREMGRKIYLRERHCCVNSWKGKICDADRDQKPGKGFQELQQTARNEDFRWKIIAGRQRIMRGQGEVKICNLPRPEITWSWTIVIPIVWEDSQTNLSEICAIFRTHPIY